MKLDFGLTIIVYKLKKSLKTFVLGDFIVFGWCLMNKIVH